MVSKVTFAVVVLAALVHIAYCDGKSWSYNWNSNGDDDYVPHGIREQREGAEQRDRELQHDDNDDCEVVSHAHSYSWSVDEDGKKTEEHEGHVVKKDQDGKIFEEHYKH